MIPSVGSHVRVDNFHPVFEARLEAFLADEGFGGLLKVFSGARTYEQQKYLYDGWIAKLPGFNLAANPDAPITPHYDVRSGKGSWHMEQNSTQYGPKGYAVDLNFDSFCWTYFGLDPGNKVNRKMVSDYIEGIAAKYLLARTVPSEEWHYQMVYSDWTTVPEEDMPTAQEVAVEVAKLLEPKLKAIVDAEIKEELRTMLGAGSATRKLLDANEEAMKEVKLALVKLLSEVDETEEDLDVLLSRVVAKIPSGGWTSKLNDIQSTVDQILSKLDT